MESLLDDSVGTSLLNIVCEERPESIFQPKKKRKNNKYERRRAKARKAKEQAIIGSSETQQRESNTPEEMEKQEAGEKGAAEVVGVSVAPSDDDHHHDEPKDINKHPYSEAISTAADNHGDSLIISKAPSVSVQQQQEQSVRSASPRPSSRRIHVDPMGDSTEARAKYLAEFHARPAEMDRKSRAVSNFETSKDSQHLFEGDGGESFESLRLHSRLVTAVESPKLGSLSRPTHIQRKAIQTLLQPSESNLFIQSETGSGKTLAYLLPIVQVGVN
jgi:primosomal protein N'